MLERIITTVLTHLVSWLFTKGLEHFNKLQEKNDSEGVIDEKLKTLKVAYKEAFNGEPITKEQRAKLNKAVADFIRNPTSNGV